MGLGDLKSQLVKAGLVSEKQARKVDQEQRSAKKKKGREAVEAEEEARRSRLAAETAQRREADRERQLARQAKLAARERELRVAQMAKSGHLESQNRPTRRWYFVSRDGRVPYVTVDDNLGGRLERGHAALVEAPGGEAWIVGRDTAERIRELDATWIRCWHGGDNVG